jgi:16S rRNA (uracil1498-N3)-methyltransferase
MTHAESLSRRPTLFAPGISGREIGEVLILDEDESRHVRALRLAAGAQVRLTDGRGILWDARLTSVGGRSTECTLDVRLIQSEALPVELVFAVGNKAHVMWLVEKATEMGVSRLQPLESERTRSLAEAGRSPAFWDKAGHRAVSAMKQSGGAWLPVIEPSCPLDDYLDRQAPSSGPGMGAEPLLVRLDGSGVGLRRRLEPWDGVGTVRMLVGPEGGWSAGEVARLDEAGFLPGSLGPLVLRFETAALAGLAVVAQQVLALDRTGKTPRSTENGR